MAVFAGSNRPRLGISGWELLVIVLIIGTFAAIAVPIFLGQARHAKDDAAEADALDLSVAIREAYDYNDIVSSVATQDGWHTINGAQVVEASPGVEVAHFVGASATSWCVELRHPRGDRAATDGMRVLAGANEAEYGTCAGYEAADAAGDAALAPGSQQVGPWGLSVLSTDRDAGAFLGQGNHPDEFRQVLTTMLVTNTSDIVQDVSMLEFSFGSPQGTENGYSPWDDWCAVHELNYAESPVLMFPGQSRVVATCVPVDPIDAEGLRMWVSHGDPTDDSNATTVFALPVDGDDTDPPEFDDFATAHARELQQAQREGSALGYAFRVEDVTVTSVGQNQSQVKITVDAAATGSAAPLDVHGEQFVVGPSGIEIGPGICTPGVFAPTLDGQPWRYDFCFTVPHDEVDALVLVIADWWGAADALTLDARPY